MLRTAATATALALAAGAASAACDAGKPGHELTQQEAADLYDCLSAEMHEGYVSGPKMWIPEAYVSGYRDWRAASIAPAAPGFHGDRFLMTWVNPTGFDEYVKYLDARGPMPAGTLIAKESFAVSQDGAATPGPLFIMEKTEPGASPESNDWYYMMVSPSGAPQAVDVMTACSACHDDLFGERDGLGYPVEEARLPR